MLCSMNCIAENIQMTEDHIAPTGSRLVSPDLRYWTFPGCLYPRLRPFRLLQNYLWNFDVILTVHHR